MITPQQSTHLDKGKATLSRRGVGSVGGTRSAKRAVSIGPGTTFSQLDRGILEALKNGSLSTKDLAGVLAGALGGINSAAVYRHCRVLQKDGWLESELVRGPRLLYCVDCGKAVTKEDYDACKEDDHDLRAFFGKKRVWRIRIRPNPERQLTRTAKGP